MRPKASDVGNSGLMADWLLSTAELGAVPLAGKVTGGHLDEEVRHADLPWRVMNINRPHLMGFYLRSVPELSMTTLKLYLAAFVCCHGTKSGLFKSLVPWPPAGLAASDRVYTVDCDEPDQALVTR